jgi:hypothetical protein
MCKPKETIVKISCSIGLGAAMYLAVVTPANAESSLLGKWLGQFKGVQIELPAERGPFGYAREEANAVRPPKFVEKPLQLDVESDSKGLATGTWTSAAGEFKKRFVCAQVSTLSWNCIDSGGRATIDVTSATEIKVCYFDNREGAQGAGCAVLTKS